VSSYRDFKYLKTSLPIHAIHMIILTRTNTT